MQRIERYREVAEQLLSEGKAYRCYCTKEELEQMRAAQRARGEKPRYDGRWRDSKAAPPPGVAPVIRFKNPLDGEVTFNDLVKGPITIANAELDDLVLLREDGVPTYNFGVVVDDLDMQVSHVIRGDDHVNNTPRQINILRAIVGDEDTELPQFAHVPMILGADGERLSKRHGAVSVMQYRDEGYLPEALLNYLARLGWSHGDAEMFSKDQLVEWFDLAHVSRSPAQFNPEKLRWLNHQYVKQQSNASLADLMRKHGMNASAGPDLEAVAGLLKDRSETVQAAVAAASMFYDDVEPPAADLEKALTDRVKPALADLKKRFASIDDWNDHSVMGAVSAVLDERKLKLPEIAKPLRLIVLGRPQSPNLGPTLAVLGKKRVLERLSERFP